MRGGLGDDAIQGGASTVDAAVYAAGIASATFGAPGAQFTVSTPSDGTDTIGAVERLQFADATVVVVGGSSAHATLDAALAAAPAGSKLYGALHVTKDSFTDAASLGALLARVVPSSHLTADIAGMTAAQIDALNGAVASFASISGGTITVLRAGAAVAYHTDLGAAVAAAAPGDRVVLGSGDFVLAQQLVVSKDLAIVGSGAASTRIRAGFSSGSTGDARSLIVCETGRAVDISAATIDATGVSMREGILHKGTGAVRDVVFNGIQAAGAEDGIAIHVEGSVTLSNCVFTQIGRAGALLGGTAAGVMEQLTYTGKGAGSAAEYGVIVDGSAHATLRTSAISNNLGVSVADGAVSAGILVRSASAQLEVVDSAITGNARGIVERSAGAGEASVSVSGSNLAGNGVAIDVRGDAAASCNWWGTVDADAIAGLAPGRVRFSPFSASQGGACSGEGAVVLAGPLGEKGRSYTTVASALAAATAGDTLRVRSGSFADGALVVNLADLTVDAAAGATGFSLVLGSADSVVLAGAGDIALTGNARANTLTANAGANAIDGAAGIDTAVLAGAFTGISTSGSSLVIGSDTVTGVELLRFADRTVAIVGRAGSELATLNQALALGGGHHLYGQLAIDKNTFASAAELTALLGRFVAGSTVSVDVLGMNAAQLAAIASHSAQLPAIAYPPIQVARAGAAAGYFASLADGLAFAIDGDTVVVPAGEFAGPIVLGRRVSLVGAGASTVIASGGIVVSASGAGAADPLLVRNLAVAGQITVTGAAHVSLDGVSAAGLAVTGGDGLTVTRASFAGDVVLDSFAGAAVLSDVAVTGAHRLVLRGAASADAAQWPVAGAIALSGISIAGGTLELSHYATLAAVAVDGVTAGAIAVDARGSLDLGVATTGSISTTGSAVDATRTTFSGSPSDLFRIEDAVTHAVDDAARGLVRVVPQSIYLSRNSGSLANAMAAASAGDTIHVEDGAVVVLGGAIAKDVRFAGHFSLGNDSFPAGADAGAVLASFVSRGAAGATFAVVTTGMSAHQLAAVGAQYAHFNAGVSGALALSSVQSAAEIANLLAGAPAGSVLVDATGMGPAQLQALAARLDRVADGGISGRIEVSAAFDAATVQSLLAKLAASAIIDVDAAGMGDPALGQVLGLLVRVDSIYNLALSDAQSDAAIAALLAKSVDAASDGRAQARVLATGMSGAKLALLAANHAKIALDGITGAIDLPGAAPALDDAQLANLLSRTAVAATVRFDATGAAGSTQALLAAQIARIDSIHGLSLTGARSATELGALLSRSDLSDAVAVATGMDSSAGGRLAALADNAAHIAAGGITGAIVLDKGLGAAQIAALLGKVGYGSATVSVDATGMSGAQLAAIADAVAAVGSPAQQAAAFDIVHATIGASLSVDRIATILAVSLPTSVTIDATGMSPAQLDLVFAPSPAIAYTVGSISINAATTIEQIMSFLAHAGRDMVLDLDPRGMTEQQLALIRSTPLMIVEATAFVHSGDEFIVEVNLRGLSQEALGMQARVVYDTTRVEYVGGYDLGGVDFPIPVWTDIQPGVINFATGVHFDQGASGAGITDGNGARLRFRALVPFCAASDVVMLSPTGFNNRITSRDATPINFTGANSEVIGAIDNLAMTGVTDFTASVAADAGTTLGAAFPEPTVQASNSCSDLAVVRTITLPDGTVVQDWPSHFPPDSDPAQNRPTVVTWQVTDDSGATLSATHRYSVAKYQLATIDVGLAGAIAAGAPFTQNITLRLDTGDVVLVPVTFTGGDSPTIDAHLPIRANYGCAQAQDVGRTLAAAQPLSIVGKKYIASGPFSLMGGDSNGDNIVDVLDFALLVADFGFGKTPGSRSNFDRDNRVGTGDFTYIGINFLHVGESCGGHLDGRAPITRVSVKELRRTGHGELAVADLNGDGWVDALDIAQAMQGGIDPERSHEVRQAVHPE